jgi:hypothetical protein
MHALTWLYAGNSEYISVPNVIDEITFGENLKLRTISREDLHGTLNDYTPGP